MYNEFVKSFLYYSSLRRHERTETIGESMSIKDLVRSLVNELIFSYTRLVWRKIRQVSTFYSSIVIAIFVAFITSWIKPCRFV